jgi:Cys-tRNA(Pro)/Cys-tRNA(Cys) deacylase
METMTTNNVTRLLKNKNIEFNVHLLEKEKHGAKKTAEILGIPSNKVFKSIVIKRTSKGKKILALVNGESDVDLKKVAKAINEKKVMLVSQNEAESITNLKSGGISPLALINKGFQFLIDERCNNFSTIHISGGERGLNIELNPTDLVSLIGGKIADISRQLDI